MKKEDDKVEHIDKSITVPISVRIPASTAYLMYLYAGRMNTSFGKIAAAILEDALPAFQNEKREYMVKMRIPQVYHAMQDANLLHVVNEQDLRERVIKRTEPGGEIGRPRKQSGSLA